MKTLRLILVCGLLTSRAVPAAGPAAVPVLDNVRAVGEVAADKGVFTVKGPNATLVIGPDGAETYRLTAEVKPADKAGRISLYAMPADPGDANWR
jgi:hypothetical protein